MTHFSLCSSRARRVRIFRVKIWKLFIVNAENVFMSKQTIYSSMSGFACARPHSTYDCCRVTRHLYFCFALIAPTSLLNINLVFHILLQQFQLMQCFTLFECLLLLKVHISNWILKVFDNKSIYFRIDFIFSSDAMFAVFQHCESYAGSGWMHPDFWDIFYSSVERGTLTYCNQTLIVFRVFCFPRYSLLHATWSYGWSLLFFFSHYFALWLWDMRTFKLTTIFRFAVTLADINDTR